MFKFGKDCSGSREEHGGRGSQGARKSGMGGVVDPTGAPSFCLQGCPRDAQTFSNQTAQGCPLKTLGSFSPRLVGGA